MSQVSTTTAMTTTPPVTVVSPGMSSLSSVTVAPSLMGLPTMLGQHDVALLPPLTPRCSGGVLGLASVSQQQPPIFNASSGLCQLCHGFARVGFFFRVEPPTILYIIMFGVCSGVCFLLSGALLDAVFTPGAQPLGFAPLQPLGAYLRQAYVQPGGGHWPAPGMHRVAAPSTTLSRWEPSTTQSAVPQPSHLYGGAYSFGGLAESHPICLPSLHSREGSSFPGLVPSNDTVNSESVMGIKPGDFGVVIGYQVDEFTHTWFAEQFVAHSHIYPGFTGKVSSLTHFRLEPGCEDYSFLDQAMADFQQGLDSILANSLETPELDTSLDEPDAITSSVSSAFLCLVSTLSDNSKLQLAPSIKSHKLWCQARALLAPVPLTTKMSASKLICYFSSHPPAFRFQSSTPPDNITLSSANWKADQSLLDLQTDVGAAAHATLDTEQLIANMRIENCPS